MICHKMSRINTDGKCCKLFSDKDRNKMTWSSKKNIGKTCMMIKTVFRTGSATQSVARSSRGDTRFSVPVRGFTWRFRRINWCNRVYLLNRLSRD
ncbi:Protein of unknown function [Pyronema omphalodes CBS 100304]|uniref:Uncharacterized protein n=1 Tax=Pyronema omphalodes (strain CBS 100304) TaxID=1076935 RepID=U4LCZ3_PYROM|nr:Protein of unknown function [Pyronema omphalodes CBS 100304]